MTTEYTTQEVQAIASLRICVHNCAHEITYLARIAAQLATDDVEFSLTLSLHNKTVCEKNKARYRISTLTEDNIFGVVRSYSNNHEKCRDEFTIPMDDVHGLKLINLLIEQKKGQLRAFEKQLQTALKLDYTPIQHLHDGHIRTSH